MEVPAKYVKVIERREKWLRDNSLPLDTVMNEPQKDAFLKEVKDEFHGSPDQKRRHASDKAGKHNVHARMKKHQRWVRECQRLAGSTHMFYLLSFYDVAGTGLAVEPHEEEVLGRFLQGALVAR